MTVFSLVALAFVLVAIIILLRPLLRPARVSADDRAGANRDIYRDQMAELERDLRAGVIGPDQAEQARRELERRVLEEAASGADQPAVAVQRRLGLPIAIALLLPVASAGLYWHLGNVPGLNVKPHAAANLSSITPEQFAEMTKKLAERMESNPDDALGWTMLGRAYRATEQQAKAAEAFGKAAALKPQDADLLAEYAEVLAVSRDRDLKGEPTRLLDRALKIDPKNPRALALAGSAAFDRKDYQGAIRHWEALLKQAEPGSELARALETTIAEARDLAAGRKVAEIPAAGPRTGRVSGVVSLADDVKSRVAAGDAVFIYVRPAEGPRMPLAVAKVKVGDLPYHFEMDDTMAMVAERKISGFARVIVGARVSRSGSATASAGDLEGVSEPVRPGTKGVDVSISKVVE